MDRTILMDVALGLLAGLAVFGPAAWFLHGRSQERADERSASPGADEKP